MKKLISKQVLPLLLLLLVAVLLIGTTVAFLVSRTDPVENIFRASKVDVEIHETFENNVKTDVSIENTGDIDAYIRCIFTVNWMDDEGNVYAEAPDDDDYVLSLKNGTQWFTADGTMYYYAYPVSSGATTEVLIERCVLAQGVTPPEGYHLSVDIYAEGIQADPVDAVTQAWNVTVDGDGRISK